LKKLCVTSGCKGGAGKSTIACLLAYALSQEGYSVLLLDSGGGDSGLLCLGGASSYANPEEGGSLVETLWESSLSSGLYVAFASPSLVNEDNLQSFRSAQLDIIVVDTNTASCSNYCSDVELDLYIFVALPNWLSWHAYQRWLGRLATRARKDNLLLVLNMYQPLLTEWKRRYAAAAEHLAVLSYDPALTFTYTRNIFEASLALSRGTKRNLRDILSKLTTFLKETHSREA
jgi:cellulose biosynthesis protein BcsQ